MSEGYKVPVTTILELRVHPNAERLEIARVYGWEIVVKKDFYKVGDTVILVPVDSVLPFWLENKLFDANSKIKLHKSRVRQIKIRGFASQGMLVSPEDVAEGIATYAEANKIKKVDLALEQDLSEMLGIKKYEPEVHDNTPKAAIKRNKPKENPLLHKYNGCENIKWYPQLFQSTDSVAIQEKLHGTNARYALLPVVVDTFWKRVKKFFGKLPSHEFCYGSNNVQMHAKKYSGFYSDNVWGKIAEQENIRARLKPGETVYGEIIGPGIQKGYEYGIPQGSHKFVIFDVKIWDGEKSYFLEPEQVEIYAREREFEMVPVLYKGPYDYDKAKELSKGPSVYCRTEKVREGVVIKALTGYNDVFLKKKALKLINEDYLADASNTDAH